MTLPDFQSIALILGAVFFCAAMIMNATKPPRDL